MAGFEQFIQTELPKRPYLQSDVPQNSVLVRLGSGARQLGAVTLSEGMTLANVGGTLTAVALPLVYDHQQTVPDNEWLITHGFGTRKFVVQCYDGNNQMFPDMIQIIDENNISITFSDLATGSANLVFWL